MAQSTLPRLGWACPSPDDMTQEELTRLLDLLADAGYAGIEPFIAAPYHFDAVLFERLLRERGLRLIGLRTGGIVKQRGLYFSASDPAVRAQASQALSQVIEYGARLGRPRILVGLMQGRLEPGVPLPQALDWIAEGLAACARIAAPLGLGLDLEPINRFELGYGRTVEEVLALVERVGVPNLRLLIDTFHMNIEERSIAAALVRAGGRIGHVHLADNNHRAPGLGHFDFREFLATLAALGYAGDLTVECDEWPDRDTALRAAARFLLPLLAEG